MATKKHLTLVANDTPQALTQDLLSDVLSRLVAIEAQAASLINRADRAQRAGESITVLPADLAMLGGRLNDETAEARRCVMRVLAAEVL